MPNKNDDAYFKDIGARVKAQREISRFTLKELEAKIRAFEPTSTTSYAYISNLENGKINPTAEVLRLLGAALNVHPAVFLGGPKGARMSDLGTAIGELDQLRQQLIMASAPEHNSMPANIHALMLELADQGDGTINWAIIEQLLNHTLAIARMAPTRAHAKNSEISG